MSSLSSAATAANIRQIAAADHRRRTLRRYAFAAAFVLPGMLLFFVFVLMPIGQSGVYSLYKWNGFGPPSDYRELANFEQLLKHSAFKSAVTHTVMLITLSLTIQLPLALGLALLVGRGTMPGRRIFRMLLFVPYVFSEIITALLWRYMLDPRAGFVNVAIGTFFPSYSPIAWLGEENLVMVAIFFVLT